MLLSQIVVILGEDWNRPEHDIPGFRGKVSDAATSDLHSLASVLRLSPVSDTLNLLTSGC